MNAIQSTLTKIISANDRIRYYDFSFEDADFKFVPGQFVSVARPMEPRPISRPYSIASTPTENSDGVLKLVVTEVPGGKVSPWIHALEEGATVSFKGAFGSFVLPEELPAEIHFVSVGTGIAPFRSMILDLFAKGTNSKIVLYNGNRHEDSILYHDDFVELAGRHDNFLYVPVVSRPTDAWTGARGYVQDHVKDHVGEPGDKLVMICGINAMIDALAVLLEERGFPKEQIHFERYD